MELRELVDEKRRALNLSYNVNTWHSETRETMVRHVTNTPLSSFFLKSTLRITSIGDLRFCIYSVAMLLIYA